jgi:magnesium-transporting ATPase (P-type)
LILKEQLIDQLERGFYLIGATAVEDKLQDEVPETIHDFIQASILIFLSNYDFFWGQILKYGC